MGQKTHKSPVEEIRTRLEAQQTVKMPHVTWDSIILESIGLKREPLLAGPNDSIHEGPGGHWKVTRDETRVILEPVSKDAVEEFRESISD
jgi:hypothetical protein